MGRIKALDKSVFEKIAAGEVIDRPSSVVRELLDNSFDANSKNIKISFSTGGVESIEVSDDGDGIFYEDLILAPQKHHTSKIQAFDDIFKVHSMGFRGEALSSIGAISRMKLTSYSGIDEHGGELYIEGGGEPIIKPYVRKKGTTVHVKNLFYNTPAREKFIKKSIRAESKSIRNIVLKKSLPFENTSVYLKNSETNKTLINVPNQSIIDRIHDFYNPTVDKKNLIEIEGYYAEKGIKLYGYIGNTNLYYHNRVYQMFYVNKRPIITPSFYYAVSSCFDGFVPPGKFPIAFVFIEIEPSNVDVNIHPAKKEIRFSNEKYVISLIRNGIKTALEKTIKSIGFDFPSKEQFPQNNESFNNFKINEELFRNTSISEQTNNPLKQEELFSLNNTFEKTVSNELPNNFSYKNNYKILGILFETYILFEMNDELYIIDFHAAHERLNYEKLKNNADSQLAKLSQRLLEPFNFELDDNDAQTLRNNLDVLNSSGYEIGEFGDNAFIVHAVPAFKTYGDDYDVIIKLINFLNETGEINDKNILLDEIFKIESCRMSVKSGDKLSFSQITKLINDLMESELPLTCPHGRPYLVKMTKNELDRKFFRF